MVVTRPHVFQRLPELRVPQQRRQIVERHDHRNVVDGSVRRHPHGAIGDAAPRNSQTSAVTADAIASSAGIVPVRRLTGSYCRQVRLWKILGIATLFGVVALGVAAERKRRVYQSIDTNDLRDRLHQRLAEAG